MDTRERLRAIPRVDAVLAQPSITALMEEYGRERVLSAVRGVLDEIRRSVLAGEETEIPDEAGAADAVGRKLEALAGPFHYRVVNATGIILNTSLGRAPLAPSVVRHICEGLSGYCRLAAHPVTGKRFDRDILTGRLLAEVFGVEAATFVNNNAAATYLVLTALVKGKEVIISRGQLVEIGGKFRIPDVLEASGAKLVEVGTTNRTHLKDYRNAITENTGAIMRVHTSNYRIKGFSSMPPIEEMAELAREFGVLCIDDIGSGQAVPFSPKGLPEDYPISRSVAAGADVVCFSGDKLFGGVQAGIILGKRATIEKIRVHPLARAFRVDKATCLGLEATARLYLNPERAWKEVPVLRMLTIPEDELKARAERLHSMLDARFSPRVAPDRTYTGGGSLPDIELPTWTVRLRCPECGAEGLARALRMGSPPVYCRVENEEVVLDVRTLLEGDEERLAEALSRLDPATLA